ncbi:MAG: hypothetical protein VX773_09110, partial [Pseudomonadota bacterium]|nr:hypothetical protein [Pseudomonadota bacterium]
MSFYGYAFEAPVERLAAGARLLPVALYRNAFLTKAFRRLCDNLTTGGNPVMTQATITSYTLLDFISEGDMDLFFSFIEDHMDEHAARLRGNGMTKFYVTRIFNKGDKFTIANWLEYRDQ